MKIRAGAVPEHFFYPWKVWLEKQKSASSEWQWTEFPGGSGDMIKALEENSLDIAFILSESALQAASRGADIELLASFVESPLQWGIFTGNSNPVRRVEDGKTYAISRFSSGSHLMAVLEADLRGQLIKEDQWRIAGNLEGARKLLRSGDADLFFWERWTTSSLVASGEFRMLSVFPGPWPAFLLCCRKGFMEDEGVEKAIKFSFKEVCELAGKIKESPSVYAIEISRVYGIEANLAEEWLAHVVWNRGDHNGEAFVPGAVDILKKAGLISQEIPYSAFSFRKVL